MIEEKLASIQTRVVFSKDKKYRYLLERVWNDKKEKATVIMINPNFADELKTDLTVCKLMNFLIDNDFGTLRIVNLYSFISSCPPHCKDNQYAIGELNDQYVMEAISDTDQIIIAWGIEKNKYKERKIELKEILTRANKKVNGFIDEKGRIGRHPSRLNTFNLIDYSWE
jgi:hypothetical protein